MTDQPYRCPRDQSCPAKRSHDTYSAYRSGCRSGAARADARRYYKHLRMGRNRARVVDATGTRRRVHALCAIGWRHADIAAHSGLPERTISHVTKRGAVLERTAAAIRDAFEQLCMTRGPSTLIATKAANWGWAPPLAWDDIDDPDEQPKYDGPRVTGLRRQLDEDVARLTEAGMTAAFIAERLDITERTVVRIRGRLRDEGDLDAA